MLDRDRQTALAALYFLTGHSCDPTFRRIARLFYFADRFHLTRCGRLICAGDYVAAEDGPVRRVVDDLLSDEGGAPLPPPDMGWLSDSEMEGLVFALAWYDGYHFDRLRDLSRDDAWGAADESGVISIEALVASVGNPPGLLAHISDPHP